MASIFDSLHMFAHIILSFFVFTGINIVSLSQCFYLQALPIGGLICGEVVVLLIAVDRLLCLVFPTWYDRSDAPVGCRERTSYDRYSRHRALIKWRYLPVYFLVCACVSVLFLYLGFLNQQRTPNK